MIDLGLGKTVEYGEELKRICDIAKKLRSLRGESNLSWEEPAEYAVKYSYMHGRSVKTLTITLNPTGCEWAKNGGCTMCGEYEGSSKNAMIPDYLHIAQFAKAIADLVSKYKPTWLRINQEGNYANTRETAPLAQLTILKLAAKIKGIERITIESRPKFLTESLLKSYSEIVLNDGVELEIGMGFEAADDVVRNVCVNKGESINDFETALNLMKKFNIHSLAYVLLKPPFLTEKEAIDEAINSIKKATDIGFERISLEPMSIHKFTVVDALSQANNYRVPWFWSVIEVVEKCKDINDIGIGGVGYFPPSDLQAHNHCKNDVCCNTVVARAIADYTKNRDVDVFKCLDCTCRLEWKKECNMVFPPLKERINQQLDSIDIEAYKDYVETNSVSTANSLLSESIFLARGSQIQNVVCGGR